MQVRSLSASDSPRFPRYLQQRFPAPEGRRPGTWRAPETTLAAPVAWSPEHAHRPAHAEIFDRLLRPPDVREATHVDPPSLAWVPVWRVELRLNGRWVYVHGETMHDDPNTVISMKVNGSTKRGLGMCTFHDARAWWVVPARTSAPISGYAVFQDEIENDVLQHRRYYELSELAPSSVAGDAFVIEGDVSEPQARHAALRGMGNRLSTSHDSELTLSRPDIAVMGAEHLLWPTYFFPYAYVGEAASAKRVEPFLVVVSARTGAIVHADHPSAARAVLSRVVRLLSFDKSALR